MKNEKIFDERAYEDKLDILKKLKTTSVSFIKWEK
jgi:hypothetical protein